MKLKYVISGTGRCGTLFAAKILTDLGIPCGHEAIFDTNGIDGAIKRLKGELPISCSNISAKSGNWIKYSEIIADSSYMSAPFLDRFDADIIHIVRNPIEVISSFVISFHYFSSHDPGNNKWHKFIYKHSRNLTNPSFNQITRAAYYYVLWNEMIESKSSGKNYFLFNIEKNYDDLLKFLQIAELPKDVYSDKKCNSRPRDSLNVLDGINDAMVLKRLIKTSEKYGYSL